MICPACAQQELQPLIERHQVPVHQNQLFDTAEAARTHPRAALAMGWCSSCGFVANQAFDASLMQYDRAYDNRQDCSPSFDAHLEGLVHALHSDGVVGQTVVEVGCGSGHFLKRLCRDGINEGIGFDPAYRGPLQPSSHTRFEQVFYGPEQSAQAADIVVCRHVIEHVAQPLALLQAIRGALVHSPSARVFFETPDVSWILKNQVIWDFFYEHCSLFTPSALRAVFARAGFEVVHCDPCFGDQYLWLEARVAPNYQPEQSLHPLFPTWTHDYLQAENTLINRWSRLIHALDGPIAVWGAGAKGTSFVNLIDPDQRDLCCVVDINPAKQNRYIAGTGHPIIGPHELADFGIRHAILMNPNYHDEILADLHSRGLDITLHAQETP